MVSSAKEKASAPVKPGDVIGDRYRVDRVIASGGMGVVVAATHVAVNRPVAIKFMHPHLAETKHGVERFEREVRLAAQMQSKHFVATYDFGTHAGAQYAVMEYCEGVDAAKYLKKNRPLPIADAVEIVVQACEGMIEAHGYGVIHRDLKPHNLFVTTQANGTLLVRVLDFGVCKELDYPHPIPDDPPVDLTLTESSVTVGSPIYMAPEQMRSSKDAARASDIWSLGVVLYELIAGRVPFDGGTMTELCLKVVNDPTPPLAQFRPDVPADLARIVERCLEKDPHKRFENMALLAEALEPFASGGGTKRGWQSQVATGDSLDFGGAPAESEVATDSSRARLIESRTEPKNEAAPPSSRGPKRKIFAQGLASGATLTILGALVAVAAWIGTRETDTKTPTKTEAAPILSPSSAASASSSPSASASASASPSSPPSISPSPSASPPPSTRHPPAIVVSTKASASASAPHVSSPNGAPILH